MKQIWHLRFSFSTTFFVEALYSFTFYFARRDELNED
jgi:hypothetical protein